MMRRALFKFRFVSLVFIAVVAGVWPMTAQAAGLGAAAGYAVLAGRAATCTTTTITGKVGVNFTTTNGCGGQLAHAAYLAFQSALLTGKPACTATIGTTFPDATTTLGSGTYCNGVGAVTLSNQTLNL